LNINPVSGRNKLLKLGRSLVETCSGNVCHQDIGTFLGEEDACFEADTTMKMSVSFHDIKFEITKSHR
jgi:hypothetical protein